MLPAFTLTSDSYLAPPAVPAPAHPPELARRLAESFGFGAMTPFGSPLAWQWFQDSGLVGPGGFPYRGASGTTNDRKGGRDLPLFWSEVDLRGFRVLSRYLCDTNPLAIGFLKLLVNYHVRKGFGWQACRKGARKTPYAVVGDSNDELVAKAQRILDTWRDVNQWPVQSREAFRRWRRDGEVFGRFFRGAWGELPSFRFVEPEQVGSPNGATEGPYAFGIEVVQYEDGTLDPATVLAYHLWDMESGMTRGQWVDAVRMIHLKANVDDNIRRGLPDFFPVQEQLEGVRKLLRNMLYTGIDQAAVAWIEKYGTALKSQVAGLVPEQSIGGGQTVPVGGPAGNHPYPWAYGPSGMPGGGNRFVPGTRLQVEGNREFESGPASDPAGHIQAAQACLRNAGTLWNFPEYFSGDASNNNMASLIVAGSPFTVTVEGSQVEWASGWERPVALKVLDLAAEVGLLTRADREQLDVETNEPAVVTPKPIEDTQRRAILNTAKVLSVPTWQQQEGLDPQHEAANFQKAAAQEPGPQGGDDGSGGGGNGGGGFFDVQESKDDSGHEHKGKGKGGGQFAKGSGGGGGGGDKPAGKQASEPKQASAKAVMAHALGHPEFKGILHSETGEPDKTQLLVAADWVADNVNGSGGRALELALRALGSNSGRLEIPGQKMTISIRSTKTPDGKTEISIVTPQLSGPDKVTPVKSLVDVAEFVRARLAPQDTKQAAKDKAAQLSAWRATRYDRVNTAGLSADREDYYATKIVMAKSEEEMDAIAAAAEKEGGKKAKPESLLPAEAKEGVSAGAIARAEQYLKSLGKPPPPPAPGMVRLYRGEFVGDIPHENAFFADVRGLAGVAIPFARSEGRHLVYTDVPKDVAEKQLQSDAVTDGEYQLPEEYRKQIKPWKQSDQAQESIITVHRADGTQYQQHRKDGTGDDPASTDAGPSSAHVTHGLARLVHAAEPEAAKTPGLLAKIQDKALTAAAKVYGLMVKATPAAQKILSALGNILDTPQDLQKLGYNPTVSSGTAGHDTGDPMRNATGISTHLAATIASHVLARVIVFLKSKKANESDGWAEAGELLSQVLQVLAAEFGLAEPPSGAELAAKLKELLGGS